MRWLPGTPGGTWLLAGLAWLAGSAGLRWILPWQPRAEWACPQEVCVGFIPDRRTLVTYPSKYGQVHGPLYFREADSGTVVEWFDADERIDPEMALSSNGALIAILHGRTTWHDKFQLFETATGRTCFDLPHRSAAYLRALCFSPDRRWFAYSEGTSGDECVHIWDVDAGSIRRTLRRADGLLKFWPKLRLAFAPDGRTLAVAETVGGEKKDVTDIQLWDWGAATVIRTLHGRPSVGCWGVHFSPDGGHLVVDFGIRDQSGRCQNQVRCWQIDDGQETLVVQGRTATVAARELWVRELDRATPVQTYEYSGRPVRKLKTMGGLAPNARTLARVWYEPHPVRDWVTARGIRWPFSEHKEVRTRLIDVETERVIAALPPWPDLRQIGAQTQVHFSPDGQLYAEPIDGGMRIWDVPPRKPLWWLLAGSALLALLLAGLARPRGRALNRLSASAAPSPRRVGTSAPAPLRS
jgi:WD40 repeat protein